MTFGDLLQILIVGAIAEALLLGALAWIIVRVVLACQRRNAHVPLIGQIRLDHRTAAATARDRQLVRLDALDKIELAQIDEIADAIGQLGEVLRQAHDLHELSEEEHANAHTCILVACGWLFHDGMGKAHKSAQTNAPPQTASSASAA